MTWSERNAFFERIVAMRERYAVRDDRTGVLSIADAVLYVEAVMTAVELDLEPWLADPDLPGLDDVAVEPGNDGGEGSSGSGSRRRTDAAARRRLLGDIDCD